MSCKSCNSNRLLSVSAKCNDLCSVEFQGSDQHDYVPRDCGIGGGDYIQLTLCLNCGTVQGDFPIADPEFSESEEEE